MMIIPPQERSDQVLQRVVLLLAFVASLAATFAAPSSATPSQQVTFETSKPPGPATGTFTSSGAFSDSGTINNLDFNASAVGAPTFQVTHVTILFTGAAGTFTLKAEIKETLTSDPNVLTDTGTWTIVDRTGAYANLHGQGTVAGTVDENVNLITRTYDGQAHFD
jgi:hypothetical protein